MVEFVNLTPHELAIFDEEGKNVIMRIPPSGQVARVKSEQRVVRELEGVPVVQTVFGDVEGLPEPREGVVYVVSTLVLSALKARGIERDDVVAPDTTPASAVRDEQGRIKGVRRFQVL